MALDHDKARLSAGPVSAMLLNQREWDMLANLIAYYLRTTPPNVLPDQRALAERIKDACSDG